MRPAASSFARRPGVAYAPAPDGHDLPVIDVTNPAFRVDSSAAGVAALRRAHFAETRGNRLAPFLVRAMLRLLARRSLLVRALMKPEASYLGGLTTYALKLGAENLVPPFDHPIDRRIGASAMVTSMRVRLQQTAELIAEGLRPVLRERPGAALHLVDIAGGPAMDSLNTLILLRAPAPELLARPIAIHVLDLDDRGPRFGAAALAALQAEGGPLAGVEIGFRHIAYDWNETAALARLLRDLPDPAIIAASSEGGLFDYGSDAAVAANLDALRDGGAALVAGSVTRADELTRRSLAGARFKLVPRGVEVFAVLAGGARWHLARAAPALISDQVLLVPA
jgi:hypothetical protein